MQVEMESDRPLLRKERYSDDDLDSDDSEGRIKHSRAPRNLAWISRVLDSHFALHSLLLVGYTTCFIWLASSRLHAGCAQRDLIYCNPT